MIGALALGEAEAWCGLWQSAHSTCLAMAHGRSVGSCTPVVSPTGWVENFLNPIHVDGRVGEISCLAYGITLKKEAEKQLLERLRENEVLLK